MLKWRNPSKQLIDNISLIPYIGIENDSTSNISSNLNVYQKISRNLFQ